MGCKLLKVQTHTQHTDVAEQRRGVGEWGVGELLELWALLHPTDRPCAAASRV